MNKSLLVERITKQLRNVLEVKTFNDGGYTTVMIITNQVPSQMVTTFCFVDDELVTIHGTVIVYDIPKVQKTFKEAYNENLSK